MTAGARYQMLIAQGMYELEMAERFPGWELPPSDVEPSERAEAVWREIAAAIRQGISSASWRQWIEPLRPIGERRGALCLVARRRVARWVRLRYAAMLGDAARACGMRGVFVYDHPEG